MIIGTNEETGCMRDVKYYLENYGDPAFMFTPDNTFPVGYGEKGMYRCELWSPRFPNSPMINFETVGLPVNAVAGSARMVIKTGKENLPDTDRIKVTYNDDYTVTLEATGISAQGRTA